MKNLWPACSACLLLLLAGCSTHIAKLDYQPAASPVTAPVQSAATLTVGRFNDMRGTRSDWLGAIRGGFGNPLKRLYTDRPTTEVVESAFRDALKSRNMLGDGPSSRVTLRGSIKKLDCSYYFNREAHAHILVELVDAQAGTSFYSQTYMTDNTEDGVGAGIFGDPDHLAQFAQKTLNETIDKALSDPALVAALRGRAP